MCSLHARRGEKVQTPPDEPHHRHSLWGDISAVACARVLLFSFFWMERLSNLI